MMGDKDALRLAINSLDYAKVDLQQSMDKLLTAQARIDNAIEMISLALKGKSTLRLVHDKE